MTELTAEVPATTQKWLQRILAPLELYHRYAIEGLDNLPAGPALVVLSHSFATYDGLLFGYRVYLERGIEIKALGDNLLFRWPLLKNLVSQIGILPANPSNGEALLRQGHLVAVAPGGMREALRPSAEKYQVIWNKRRGFIRLAIKMQVPLVLVACPRADDIYTVYDNRLTKMIYKNFKVPLPLIRGLGPTFWPRPVKLVHYVSKPIIPPRYHKSSFEDQVKVLHKHVQKQMTTMLAKH